MRQRHGFISCVGCGKAAVPDRTGSVLLRRKRDDRVAEYRMCADCLDPAHADSMVWRRQYVLVRIREARWDAWINGGGPRPA